MADRLTAAPARLARRARHLYGYWRAEQRTLRQGIASLAVSTFAGFVAGLVLGSLGAGLLMIRPQFMGTGGDAPEVLLVFGAIAVSLGVGAVLASVAAFAASKVWQNEAA